MGHIRLGGLPRTRGWEQVVDLIRRGGDAASVTAAVLGAAEERFNQAAGDEGLAQATWLLAQLPLAARASPYVERLDSLGLCVVEAPGVLDLLGAFADAIDTRIRQGDGRTDFGEMAQMAAAETLTAALGERSKSLFGATPENVRRTLAALATREAFGSFARDYFACLTRRFLGFYLSRELPNHVGGNRRFTSITAHTEFNAALEHHCRQAAGDIEEFAGNWFAEMRWRRGVSPKDAGAFAWIALERLRSVLREGAGEP